MELTKNRHARWLFDGAADRYDMVAQVFSFFQYGRWRRYLISPAKCRSRSQGYGPPALGLPA